MSKLPQAMVLVYDERLGHSMWIDCPYHGARTLKGLVKKLAAGVKSGEYVGYRLMRTEFEVTGICPEYEKQYLDSRT